MQKTKQTVETKAVEARAALPATLRSLQHMRTNKNVTDAQLHKLLDEAWKECKAQGQELVLWRMLLHIGDINREHNMLKKLGIKAKTGGAQERTTFRSVLRWWDARCPKYLYDNLGAIVEFTSYESLMYFQNTTEKKTGKLVKKEFSFLNQKSVQQFLVRMIYQGKDLNLIAKHLPKYESGKKRVSKITFRAKKDKTTFTIQLPKNKEWYKLNGVMLDQKSGTIDVKVGDVLSYPRSKQGFTLERQKYINAWISSFCKENGWSVEDYKEFRKNQNTSEQVFSSKEVLSYPRDRFMELLDRLTSGQRFRVAKMLAYKDEAGKLVAKPGIWNKVGGYYVEWENAQTKIAETIRTASTKEEKEVAEKQLKVKAVGVQTIDLLVEMFKGNLTNDQINNTYQAWLQKLDMHVTVFPIVDGSASMDSYTMHNGVRISYRQIAYTLLTTFATQNPVESFRNSFGWFSNSFHICGRSKFVDNRPNNYLSREPYTKQVKEHEVLSEKKTFTENLEAVRRADPREVSSTNMGTVISYFVSLVQTKGYNVEDLPNVLLYITDCENNTGMSPKQAQELAAQIGWYPLQIFWSIQAHSRETEAMFKGVPNSLFIGGFNEGVLTQILRNIKDGSIDPEVELWAINDDPRYSVLK